MRVNMNQLQKIRNKTMILYLKVVERLIKGSGKLKRNVFLMIKFCL